MRNTYFSLILEFGTVSKHTYTILLYIKLRVFAKKCGWKVSKVSENIFSFAILLILLFQNNKCKRDFGMEERHHIQLHANAQYHSLIKTLSNSLAMFLTTFISKINRIWWENTWKMFFLVLIPNYVVRKKNMQDNAGQNPAAILKSATITDKIWN